MRTNGLINFVLISSATTCLMTVVTKTDLKQANQESFYEYQQSKLILPLDSPDTEKPDLHYKFNDNGGKPPLTEPKSKLYLEDPENIKTDVKYNPQTGNYDIKQKVGKQDYRPETYMTAKEYRDYVFKKQMREYWRSRVAADELNNQPRKGLIPKLQVNSELFDRIFGGNTVDIKPNGTAELIFGFNRNVNRNPAIPQRQQAIPNFDFDMRIQLNLVGKIGEKLKINGNYNTEASFSWENQMKMDYTGLEDEILKKIEAGNVSLPLNSSLISGSQTLFGLKTEMQFGKLRATTVFSQQNGKKTEITVQGGAQMQTFNLSADNYEQNKHYFLGHYFRENYDDWMKTLPVINTPIVITKIEVYMLGINGSAEQTRNIVAFEDLGEDSTNIWSGLSYHKFGAAITPTSMAIRDTDNDKIPHNGANSLYNQMTNSLDGLLKERNIDTVSSLLSSAKPITNPNNPPTNYYMESSRDYNIIRNAKRLNPTDYYFNPRTGFISLNQQLNNEQALAVSYQYTYRGNTYQVGEFSEQVPDNKKLLVCKLLKSAVVNVRHPMWKLMMKNVYSLGAYNLNPQDFKLDVYYNNIETSVDVPYLPYGLRVNGVQLIKVLGCDRLSVNGDGIPDGVYDFLPGYTISSNNGRAYFTTVEPFGRSLEKNFTEGDFPGARKYIFKELYDSTRTAASFIQEKNRYRIKGSYRSSSGSEIALNALNIPQGAVVVTANGVALSENTDYTVDYTLGRVKIINEGILNSGATIKVSLESNSLFSVQQKSLWGARFDYKAGRNLTMGSTLLRFNERPITAKVPIGDEPVSNFIAGFDYNYKTDVPFITRLLDKLPFYSTKEMSNISTRGEIAKLFPGNAKAIRKNGGNSYIDDFEGSVSLIDIKGANSWFLASVPQGQSDLFKEAGEITNTLPGINRARLSWYNVDAMFTREQNVVTPAYYVSKKLFSNNMWRQVFESDMFPGKTPPNGQKVVLPMLDLAYYPSERGPYNYDVAKITGFSAGIKTNGKLNDPKSRWGGIMRRLETNDFQAANIEYIQFWMMDPFNEDYNKDTDPAFSKDTLPSGDLYINLGNISEDIVKDGRMVYENGLPGKSASSSNLKIDSNQVANIPVQPPIINAFSADNNDRPFQDVGYDGLTDEQERYRFKNEIAAIQAGNYDPAVKAAFADDPSNDRYHFFRGDDYDEAQANTLQRYARYNYPEGNSPTESQSAKINKDGYPTGATTLPNIEDINRDNTLSETENYYQYHVKISKDDVNPLSVGTNFIVDAFDETTEFPGVTKTVKWYQFKIPISQFEKNVGSIEGFNSIRFMRVFLRGFDRPVLLRLARFELVRSDWRRYQFDLKQPGEYISIEGDNTPFDVSAVSLQENANKIPVNYVMPPDIDQQQNVQTTNLVLQNEQALQMRVCNLRDGDSRAIFKNIELDSRMFKNIKMNVHAESPNGELKDGDLTLFFRVGSDYNNNFYEYEVPLKLTPKGVYDPNSVDDRYAVWPKDNEVNFKFEEDIADVKTRRNQKVGYYKNLEDLGKAFSVVKNGYTVTIVGNPNIGTIKSVMIGIRNPKGADNKAFCAEVWVNELRLTEFNNKGGWATTGQLQAKLADLGTLSLAGTYKSPFWGSVESKINERSREKNANWDVSTQINAGKFLPNKWKITLPVFYNYGQTKNTPLFNPLDPDVKMDAIDDLKGEEISDALKDKIKDFTIDRTERKGFNLSNVRIEGFKRPKAKPMPWDVSNFTATYAYNEIFKSNVNVEKNITKQQRGNLQYSFALKNPFSFKPFAKTKNKLLNKKWMAIIKDFNLQLLPNSFGAAVDVNRNYSALKNRDITSFYNQSPEFSQPSLVNKTFFINRNYNFRWDISKSLKYDYMATNEGRIFEAPGENWKSNKPQQDYLKNTFFKGRDTTFFGDKTNMGRYGENTTFRQQMNLNFDVPLNKIPILDFIRTTYRFGGTYTWNRRPFAVHDSTQIGNTIQNTYSHNLTGNINLTQLYNKIPYLKRIMTPGGGKSGSGGSMARSVVMTDNKKDGKAAKDTTKKNSSFKEIAEFLARAVIMVKSISINYQRSGGQALPNFKPSSQYGGMDFREHRAPGFLFTTGLPDDRIRERSIDNGWLTTNTLQSTPFTQNFSQNLTYRTSLEPHGSLKIELNGSYTQTDNQTAFIVYHGERADTLKNQRYYGKYLTNQSPNISSTFNITTFNFFNSFKDGKDPVQSKLFDDFLLERQNVAKQLRDKNETASRDQLYIGGNLKNPYYDGYTNNQQDVLMGAFYNTYTGRKIKNYDTKHIFPQIPLPNWTITWDGLGKLPSFKKTFRGITIRHSYKSSYNMGGITNNVLFNSNGFDQTVREPVSPGANTNSTTPNFVPFYKVNTVTMDERFEPLIKFDFQFVKPGWSANVEARRNKTTTLNLTGFQIIETKGQEYVIGLGYLYPKLRFKKIKIQGKVLESNLNVKVDLSYRRNISVIRQFEITNEASSTPTGGTDIITLRTSADYMLTPDITLRLFYDWIKTKPQTSNTFPTSNINAGFSLRINFQ